jgi:hypothetical protein
VLSSVRHECPLMEVLCCGGRTWSTTVGIDVRHQPQR